jgi:hypothetical protein
MLDEWKRSPGGLEFQKRVIPRYVVFVYVRNLRSLASGNGGAWHLFHSQAQSFCQRLQERTKVTIYQ